MKKSIVMMAMAIATLTVVSCNKKAEAEPTTETTEVSKEIAKAEYICPMDCEKGKTYEAEGKCPTCSMALVEKKHDESDGHEHSKTKELTPEEKEHGHSHGEEGHDH